MGSCVLGAVLIMVGPATAGAAAPVPSSPVAAEPDVMVVQLGTAFSPGQIQLSTGQQFEVLVSSDVQATGLSPVGECTPGLTAQVDGGLLELQCVTQDDYLYTAENPGSVTLVATVRPACAPGTICPSWVIQTSLQVTILP